jgi:hypothetical protein
MAEKKKAYSSRQEIEKLTKRIDRLVAALSTAKRITKDM